MIVIENVSKAFHSLVAIDQVTLNINRGEVLGVLGPNGAGKTTLFKLIAGLLSPDSGNIRTDSPNWPRIGYKPERLLFPNHLRVRDYLNLVFAISDGSLDSRAENVVSESLNSLDIYPAARKRIRECSKGMRQRLALAQAMIGQPDLLLLDEPSNGLDPSGQHDICLHIKRLQDQGRTIVLASHQLSEVTQVCTHLVIMNHGRILYANSMKEALTERPSTTIKVDKTLEPVRSLIQQMHSDILFGPDHIILEQAALHLRRQILSLLLALGFDIVKVEQSKVTLDEIYEEAIQ